MRGKLRVCFLWALSGFLDLLNPSLVSSLLFYLLSEGKGMISRCFQKEFQWPTKETQKCKNIRRSTKPKISSHFSCFSKSAPLLYALMFGGGETADVGCNL